MSCRTALENRENADVAFLVTRLLFLTFIVLLSDPAAFSTSFFFGSFAEATLLATAAAAAAAATSRALILPALTGSSRSGS